ncbi:hypothetical protein AB0H34_37520 [Saccharopolyspora shandongensis]|uniref:hypothetical protein n=1 Tax=Saccharopolyspora shandongensis TaxID=418495 RepID=UPI0033E62587
MGYTRLRYTIYGGPRYTAYYWDLRGRQRSAGTFARQRDAERAWRRAEAQIADGKFVNLATGRQRFARYVTEVWLPNHVMELNTRQGYQQITQKYLLGEFGSMRMNELLPDHIRDSGGDGAARRRNARTAAPGERLVWAGSTRHGETSVRSTKVMRY